MSSTEIKCKECNGKGHNQVGDSKHVNSCEVCDGLGHVEKTANANLMHLQMAIEDCGGLDKAAEVIFRKQIESQNRGDEKMPDIYKCPDCGESASDHECPDCDGLGEIDQGYDWVDCDNCDGGMIDGEFQCDTCGNVYTESDIDYT